ncbi:MAG: carbon storage regulator CsrA [Planctomycetales bacterium]|nr:carbon storage regulator CsrA [Planctomycetales bacterium]
MLVLSRKTNEAIHIGENITITVLKLKGNAVRLGIEAPKDVRVMRSEIATTESAVSTTDSSDSSSSVTIAISPNEESKEVAVKGESGSDVEAACTSTIFESRCAAESFLNAGEDTRCSSGRDVSPCDGGYEGDCWSVSSMQRRVQKVIANRK